MIRLATLAALPLLAACASTGYAETPQLAGTEWRFVAIDGQAPASDRARMAFTAERISATAGCNGMGGTWTIEGDRLMGGPYASTMMFCDGLMEQERAIGALLAEKPVLTVAGDRLTLSSDSHKAELVRAD
ncbi:META domain-containing protein [Altererythrobacter sp. H2]|uniref:META domain-containing protein n=1 Tax=Altererythrobacter sp. H2 TaxID=3108391 RepID=UPI002B4C0D8B|nr:META domain-containing protein [Altererythrobacter sp. H2]WRK96739.1 META domain-containing protein [Altererythrobacter sp. H2]